MSALRVNPEEQLEKQYRDYKAQFEEWKESNRDAIGSEAYIAYMQEFESWERDVDKRRKFIRGIVESDPSGSQASQSNAFQNVVNIDAKRKKETKEVEVLDEKRKQQLEAETAAQAAAYAQHQQSYLAHHQAALLKEELRQISGAVSSSMAHDLKGDNSKLTTEPVDPNQVAETMKQMAHLAHALMNEQNLERLNPEGSYHQPLNQMTPQPAYYVNPAPQLWGNDRIVYSLNDPLFKRWGMRAAPPYHKPAYRPPPGDHQISPCWLFAEKMREEKLMIAPQMNVPPPPILNKFAVSN